MAADLDNSGQVVAQPRRRRTVVIVSALALGTVAAVGVLVLAFIDVSHRPGNRVESAPTGISTTTTASASTSPLAAAMRDWKTRAGDHFKESANALQDVSDAADAGDDAELRSGCQRLHDANSVGLQADLPTPDPALTAELQRMIDDMNAATHACLRFTDSKQPDDASTYQDYLSRAMEHLHEAKTILDADSGKG